MNSVLARRCWSVAVVIPTMFMRPMAASITVSGSPGNLVVNTAVAGSPPTSAIDATTTYTIVATGATLRGITGKLNTAPPAGVTITVTLAACGGGTSYGPIVLTTVAQNLVHGISTTSCTAAITYQVDATAAAGVVALQSKTVTLNEIALP